MNKTAVKQQLRARRHNKIRSRVSGTADVPRLAIFRSNKFIYAQLIDDAAGATVGCADSRTVTGANATERATAVGTAIAEVAKKADIEKVVFDRGGFKYQGAVAALADAARAGGLQF